MGQRRRQSRTDGGNAKITKHELRVEVGPKGTGAGRWRNEGEDGTAELTETQRLESFGI